MGLASGEGSAKNIFNLGLGTTLAGGLLSAGGALGSGYADAASYEMQAAALENQARLDLLAAERQNDYASDTAARQLTQIKRQGSQTRGAQRAAAGASGALGSGSAAELLLDSLSAQAQDEELIRLNTARANYERTLQAQLSAAGARGQAAQYRIAGQSARKAGRINALSSVLGTASQAGQMYLSYKDLL